MKSISAIIALLLFSIAASAQIYYATPAIPENPGNLNNDSESPVGNGLPASWTVILGPGNSSPTWSPIQTIPFPFEFNGQTVNKFKASSSGVVTFDENTTLSAPGYTNATLPNSAIPNKSVMIWGLKGSGSNDNLVTKVFGTSPNRQLWIFFSSYSFASSGQNGYAYFSIVLEETTNHIYMVDQRHSGTMYLTIGVQVDAGVGYNLTGSPNVGALSGTQSDKSDNFHYAFYPGPQPTLDASCQAILLPSPADINNAPFTLQGKFGNYGLNTISSATINYRVNGGTTVSSNLTGLNLYSTLTSTLTHPTPWNPGLGTYNVEMWLSNVNGMTDLKPDNDVIVKEVVVSNNVGIEELDLSNFLIVSPNPFTNYLLVEFSGQNAQTAKINLLNSVGQVVFSTSQPLIPGKNHIDVPAEDLASGMYLINIEMDGAVFGSKLFKP